MLVIKHRINSLHSLQNVSTDFGIEVDLHYYDSDLYIGHDPWNLETTFDTFLAGYQHKFMAINVKQEGIETMILQSLKKYHIKDFFLFDVSFPSLMRLLKTGERRFALRISDFEQIKDIGFFQNKVEWIWLDVFQDNGYLDDSFFSSLESFKKCIVSPELHIDRDKSHSLRIRESLLPIVRHFQAVCTKDEYLWLN